MINSDESGIFNLYELNLADGSKKKLTSSNVESFYSIDYVPGSESILYSANKGGNEIDHIYLLEEGGKTTDLTPGENEKASFFKWSQDKKSMFYTSNLRDPKYFDVYKSAIGEWKPVMFYENKDGLNVEDISDDEKTLAISKTITTSENELYLINRETGAKTDLSLPDQKGKYEISGFSKDSRYAFYITDAGKEFAYLVRYDIQNGERTVLYETNWDVMYSFLSGSWRWW